MAAEAAAWARSTADLARELDEGPNRHGLTLERLDELAGTVANWGLQLTQTDPERPHNHGLEPRHPEDFEASGAGPSELG